MDLIVCGDALWISCGTWIAVWGGLIGAAVSAVLAAAVALGVVYATNRHQTRLVDWQLKAADKSAADALARQQIDQVKMLREQRAALNKQLTEQREGLRLQLDEQRREASRNREHSAIAEVLASLAESNIHLYPTNPLDDMHLARFAAAVGRWQLETTNSDLRDELGAWSLQWWWAIRESRTVGLPYANNNIGSATTRAMLDFAREWPNADEQRRESLLSAVVAQRGRLAEMGVDIKA